MVIIEKFLLSKFGHKVKLFPFAIHWRLLSWRVRGRGSRRGGRQKGREGEGEGGKEEGREGEGKGGRKEREERRGREREGG